MTNKKVMNPYANGNTSALLLSLLSTFLSSNYCFPFIAHTLMSSSQLIHFLCSISHRLHRLLDSVGNTYFLSHTQSPSEICMYIVSQSWCAYHFHVFPQYMIQHLAALHSLLTSVMTNLLTDPTSPWMENSVIPSCPAFITTTNRHSLFSSLFGWDPALCSHCPVLL